MTSDAKNAMKHYDCHRYAVLGPIQLTERRKCEVNDPRTPSDRGILATNANLGKEILLEKLAIMHRYAIICTNVESQQRKLGMAQCK